MSGHDPFPGEHRNVDQEILKQADELATAPTPWETQTLEALLALPRITVTRPPEDQLLAAGMVPLDCHVNCSAQAAHDPERSSRHVWGWWVHGPILVLHSVIERNGSWFCLTPQMMPMPETFEFIPDDQLSWRISADGEHREPLRYGENVPRALRRYPDLHVRYRDELRAMVNDGLTAFQARCVVGRKMDDEVRVRDSGP